jgi:hypothetical protein
MRLCVRIPLTAAPLHSMAMCLGLNFSFSPSAPCCAPLPTDGGAYEKALRQFLKKEGVTNLSTLGSKVPGRPAGLKMKKFLEDRPHLFRIDTEGKVHLAK